jgi:hypothetical protein
MLGQRRKAKLPGRRLRYRTRFAVLASVLIVTFATTTERPAAAPENKATPDQALSTMYQTAVAEKVKGTQRYEAALWLNFLAREYRSDHPPATREEAQKRLSAFQEEWKKVYGPEYRDLEDYKTSSERLGVVTSVINRFLPGEVGASAGAVQDVLQYLDKQFIAKWQSELDAEASAALLLKEGNLTLQGEQWVQESYQNAWDQCNNLAGQEAFCNTANALVGAQTGVPIDGTPDDYIRLSPAVKILDGQTGLSKQIADLKREHGEAAGKLAAIDVDVDKLTSLAKAEFGEVHSQLETVEKYLIDIVKRQEQEASLLEYLKAKDQKAEERRQQQAEAARKAEEYQRNLQGARSAIFLLTSIVGIADPALGAKLAAVGNAAVHVVDSMIQYGTGMAALGAVAAATGPVGAAVTAVILVGNLVSAGMGLISALFGGGPTENEKLRQDIERVRQDIQNLHKDMTTRFDRIDHQLVVLTSLLTTGLRQITEQLGNISSSVHRLEDGLLDISDTLTRHQTSSFAVHSPAAAHAAWTSMISVEVGSRG